jgi:hypothetical protein
MKNEMQQPDKRSLRRQRCNGSSDKKKTWLPSRQRKQIHCAEIANKAKTKETAEECKSVKMKTALWRTQRYQYAAKLPSTVEAPQRAIPHTAIFFIVSSSFFSI